MHYVQYHHCKSSHTCHSFIVFFCLNIASCFEHNVFFMSGSVVEPSTLSSCFTWKTTKLNCVCAPKTPTDRAAVYSRNLQPHTSLLQLHRRLWSFDNGKLTCLSKMETIKPIKIIQSTSRVSKYSRTSLKGSGNLLRYRQLTSKMNLKMYLKC